MKVYITYNERNFKDTDFNYLNEEYELNVRSFGIRHGAIDLVSALEFVFVLAVGNFFNWIL